MGYEYAKERPRLFEEGTQKMFLSIRDRAQWLFKQAGAATMGKLISEETGSCWTMMACVDRLVEMGELKEVHNTSNGWAQDRLFVKPN